MIVKSINLIASHTEELRLSVQLRGDRHGTASDVMAVQCGHDLVLAGRRLELHLKHLRLLVSVHYTVRREQKRQQYSAINR